MDKSEMILRAGTQLSGMLMLWLSECGTSEEIRMCHEGLKGDQQEALIEKYLPLLAPFGFMVSAAADEALKELRKQRNSVHN